MELLPTSPNVLLVRGVMNSKRSPISKLSFHIFCVIFAIISTSRLINGDEYFELKSEIIRRLECALGQDIDNNCPIDGGWSMWGKWGPCEGECGQVGLKKKSRNCTCPVPQKEGKLCQGSDHETAECRMHGCSEDDYKAMVSCNPIRLNEFNVIHEVHKDYPALIERCLEAECHYKIVLNILNVKAERYWNALHCVKHNSGCPVYGGWSEWGRWSECTARCGMGRQISCRSCDNPRPSLKGWSCHGDNCTYQPCVGKFCHNQKSGMWSIWSRWSKCTASCGQGLRRRERVCVYRSAPTTPLPPWIEYTVDTLTLRTPKPKSACLLGFEDKDIETSRPKRQPHHQTLFYSTCFCTGSNSEYKPCYTRDCPVDGRWSDWEPWSQCSTACGRGVQSRSRACSSPPPSHGGKPCIGPITWIRHCFLAPCQYKSHELAVFYGDGTLQYYKTGQASRLLHLYIRFRPFCTNGYLIQRDSKGSAELSTSVTLSLQAGYIVFSVVAQRCLLTLISRDPVKTESWTKVLIMLTSHEAVMRLDDSNVYQKSYFSYCQLKLPNFDSHMIVGANFTGQIEKLSINFTPRKLNLTEKEDIVEPKSLSPYSNLNVAYDEGEMDEIVKDLDELIFVPCSNEKYWSIELVIKTAVPDGLVMLVKDFYLSKMLVLSVEPHRVQLQLLVEECLLETYQAIESHLGRWLYITVDYSNDTVWGLTVNGGQKRLITAADPDNEITCMDHILIGDVAPVLKRYSSQVQVHMDSDSMKGLLAYLRLDGKVIDLETLAAESEYGSAPVASDLLSYSKNYDEVELQNGQQLNLSCFFYSNLKDEIMMQKLHWNYSGPVWLYFDTPLIPCDIYQMDEIGINYTIKERALTTYFKAYSYTSRETIENFYSCWLPCPKKSDERILYTYGVTVINLEVEFTNSAVLCLKITMFLLELLVLLTVIWLLFELLVTYSTGWGLFSNKSIVKHLRETTICEMIHSSDANKLLGIKNKFRYRQIPRIRNSKKRRSTVEAQREE